MAGTGVGPATLVLSNSPLYNYGTKATGSSTDATLTLDNTGGYQASSIAGLGLAAPFSFKGGTYPGTGGSCGTTLSAGSNCTVVVTYSPSTVAVHSDTIQIDYNDGVSAQSETRDVQGTGVVAASLDISHGPTYDFGTKALGSNTDHTFTIDNTGGATATAIAPGVLTAPFTFKGGSYPGTGGTCGGSLAAAGSCTVVVTYSPTATGVHSDTMTLNYQDGAGAAVSNRDVQGIGANPAVIAISNAPNFDFGTVTVGSTTDQTLTLAEMDQFREVGVTVITEF